jgi:pimeloyl-ACP methyl ester carboxylesterase
LGDQGYVDHDGARIWYATLGSGFPVILLHGGFGHSGNWSYQIPTLVSSGHRAVLIGTRGHVVAHATNAHSRMNC